MWLKNEPLLWGRKVDFDGIKKAIHCVEWETAYGTAESRNKNLCNKKDPTPNWMTKSCTKQFEINSLEIETVESLFLIHTTVD